MIRLKGFKDSKKKFHPIRESNGVRKPLDQSVKMEGVKIRKARDNNAEILRNRLRTFNRRFPVELEYGDAGGKLKGLKVAGTHSFLVGSMTRSEAIMCLEFADKILDMQSDGRMARDMGVFVNNGNLSYHAKILPNGNIMRTYSSGIVRIVDPDTGRIVRATLGDEDPFKCRQCGEKLKDTDVVTVCERCDKVI